jgi:hypothetical protein
MLLLLLTPEQKRQKRKRQYWIGLLAVILLDLGMLIAVAKYNDRQLMVVHQRNSALSKRLVSLQKRYTQDEQKLNILYSTLSFYARNSRYGVIGSNPRSAPIDDDPGFNWVRYSHEYEFSQNVHFSFVDLTGGHEVEFRHITAWLVSNDQQLSASYVYDSSVVTADLLIRPACPNSDDGLVLDFSSYYLDQWVSYYPKGPCQPVVGARAREFLQDGTIFCTVQFASDNPYRVLGEITTHQPL